MGKAAGRPRVHCQNEKEEVIRLYDDGVSPANIFKHFEGAIPKRTIGHYLENEKQRKKIVEAVKVVLESNVLEVTLQSVMKSANDRKQWLMMEAVDIWKNLPDSEKHTAKVFLKIIELAQKDDELILKPLMLGDNAPTVPQTSTEKSLEEKLGILDEPDKSTA